MLHSVIHHWILQSGPVLGATLSLVSVLWFSLLFVLTSLNCFSFTAPGNSVMRWKESARCTIGAEIWSRSSPDAVCLFHFSVASSCVLFSYLYNIFSLVSHNRFYEITPLSLFVCTTLLELSKRFSELVTNFSSLWQCILTTNTHFTNISFNIVLPSNFFSNI